MSTSSDCWPDRTRCWALVRPLVQVAVSTIAAAIFGLLLTLG